MMDNFYQDHPQALETTERVSHCPICNKIQFEPFRKVEKWQLMRCLKCSFVFLSPRPKPDHLLSLYNSPEYFSNRIQKHPEPEEAVQRAEGLVPFLEEFTDRIGKPGTLLEIGCGYGFVLAAAKYCGWDVIGLEPSKHAAQFVRRTYNIPIIQDSAEAIGNYNLGQFDAIIMFSVIEHLLDPVPVLRNVRSYLASNGVLWGVVPNVQSLDRFWHGDQWSGWDLPYHLWHFSPSTITQLLLKTGFQKIQTENSFFNPVNHLQIGWKNKNLRLDKRPWQGSGGASTSVRTKRQVWNIIRLKQFLKTIFSERDMKIWAS